MGAEPTIVKDVNGDFKSFHVKACPEYIPDDKRIITTYEIAEILGFCEPWIVRRPIEQTIEDMKEKGYTVKYNKADKLWYELRR